MPDKATASPRNKATASGPSDALASSSVADLRRAVKHWIADGKAQGWSPHNIRDREQFLEHLAWWLENEEETSASLSALSPLRVRSFLTYCREARPEGRWGSDRASAKREARPATVNAHFRALRAFVNFCLAEGLLTETPLRNVKPPRIPKDQIQPLSHEQVQALLDVAKRTRTPERDVAIILLLVDSGMRVGELCGLTVGDVDRGSGELVVTGKGNKVRRVYMGVASRRALWRYLETSTRRQALADEALFTAESGHTPGAGLTTSGVQQILQKLGQGAGIVGVRCSPHTLRHTFALSFLRNGGDIVALQGVLGHEDISMVRRYLKLTEADLSATHKKASPADRWRLK